MAPGPRRRRLAARCASPSRDWDRRVEPGLEPSAELDEPGSGTVRDSSPESCDDERERPRAAITATGEQPTGLRHGPMIGGDAVRARALSRSASVPRARPTGRPRDDRAGRAAAPRPDLLRLSTLQRPILYTPLDDKPKRSDDPMRARPGPRHPRRPAGHGPRRSLGRGLDTARRGCAATGGRGPGTRRGRRRTRRRGRGPAREVPAVRDPPAGDPAAHPGHDRTRDRLGPRLDG